MTTEPSPKKKMHRRTCALLVVLFFVRAALAQDVFSANGGSGTTQDEFSTNCSKTNPSPYAGMDPVTCHGVMALMDSRQQCSLPGMKVLKRVGNSCYYLN